MYIDEKFIEFPEVYYISFIANTDRRNLLELQLKKRNITNLTPIISTVEIDEKNIVTGTFINNLSFKEISCVAAHLKAIKTWYLNSNSTYAIFFEDDVTLETSNFWNFTWKDFVNRLPENWDCIQLVCIREKNIDMYLRKRIWNDWSVAAYMITRDYAKFLIELYYKDDIFTLNLKDTHYWPIVENTLYFFGKTYTIPLFAENPIFKTTMRENDVHQDQHMYSSNYVLNWWKIHYNNIYELINPINYINDLEFNR